MVSVLVQLLPFVVGSIMMPTWILLILVLLRSGKGPVEAIAFVAGITAVRLLQGVIFGMILNAYEVAQGTNVPEIIVSTLLLVTGIVLWVTALRQMRQEDDPDTPLPKWMTMIRRLTPFKALGLGGLLVVTSSRAWLFTLAALGVIGQAALSSAQSIVAFLLYVLAAELLLVAPILMSMRSSARFDAMAFWLESRNRPIVIVASFVVGGFFLWRGITGLIG